LQPTALRAAAETRRKRRVHAPLIEELTSGEEEKGRWNDEVRWPKHGGAMGG